MPSKKTLVRRLLAVGFCGAAMALFLLPPASAQEDLKAPGDCTEARHAVLQNAVREKCDRSGTMRCIKTDDCDTVQLNIGRFDACINARVKIDTECFRGGNAEHHGQIQQRKNGRKLCVDRLVEIRKYESCPDPVRSCEQR
jgi:hypothetical protein